MQYVTIQELANELGMDRSSLRRYVLKNGFTPVSIRGQDSRGQLTLAFTSEDAEAVRALRTKQGFSATFRAPVDNGHGFFYVIQLIPELDPLRVKLGWTNDVGSRLDAHRTAAPTAELVKSWPCRKSWEIAAMHSVTRVDCTHIANEVYRCNDIDSLVARCDQFFAIMPME